MSWVFLDTCLFFPFFVLPLSEPFFSCLPLLLLELLSLLLLLLVSLSEPLLLPFVVSLSSSSNSTWNDVLLPLPLPPSPAPRDTAPFRDAACANCRMFSSASASSSVNVLVLVRPRDMVLGRRWSTVVSPLMWKSGCCERAQKFRRSSRKQQEALFSPPGATVSVGVFPIPTDASLSKPANRAFCATPLLPRSPKSSVNSLKVFYGWCPERNKKKETLKRKAKLLF